MKLIYGRAGSGKSEYIFQDIKEKIKENKNKIYIITPEQFSFTAERRLIETLEESATTQVEVLSFERMAYRVINETVKNTKDKIEKSGKAMIVFNAINKNQKQLQFLGKSLENVDLIITQITEFKKHNITVESLKNQIEKTENQYLKSKLNDMLIMYTELEDKIEEKFLDENDVLTILAENIKNSHLFDNAIFYIDEFAGFTKQEYLVISKINEIAKELYITVCTDSLKVEKMPEADIFYDNKQTIQSLKEIADIENEKQIKLNDNHRFKNAELKHLEKNIYDVPYYIYDKEIENIKLYLAENPYEEVEYVSGEIIKLVRDKKYRFRDIAVICNNIEIYSNLCKAIFEEHEIPVFIDDKKDITQNILIKFIIALLDVLSKNWSYESVFNYLKTGLIDIDNIYEIENYCLKYGIQGKKFYDVEWYNEKEDYREEQKKIVDPILEIKEKIGKEKNAKQISEVMYDFLVKTMEGKQKLEDRENIDAWNLIVSVLNEIINIFENQKMTFDEYSKILKMGISSKELGQIPQTQDKVIVGNVNRSKTHKVKAVFIIGANDGVFPSVNNSEGFFNDKDRKNLKEENFELAKGTKEKLYEENFNIYKAFSTAEEKLFISYPSSDNEGKALRKSMLLIRLKKIFPKLQEETRKQDEILTKKVTFSKLLNNLNEEDWNEVYAWYENNEKYKLQKALEGLKFTNAPEKLTKENIDKLYGYQLNTSVSRLESYSACPFSYYLKYGLKLSEKEKLDIKPIDTGTFMHDVIDQFFKHLDDYYIDENGEIEEISEEQNEDANFNRLTIKNIDDNAINKIVFDIIEEKLKMRRKIHFKC